MDMLCFQQQGILPRHEILRRLVEKLRTAGKLVIVHNI